MTITAETHHIAVPSPAQNSPGRRGLQSLGRRFGLSLRAIAAGMHASKDYRLLNGMSDGQLRVLGLTRDEIPRELHRRHFERLSSIENTD